MKREKGDGHWTVRLHDDDINTFSGIVYVLHRLLGLPPDRGLGVAREVTHAGLVELMTYPSRQEAEALVRTLQLYGLYSTARESR